jgi:cytochrome c
MFPMKDAGKIGAFIAALVFAGATANPGYAQDAEHGKTIFKACATCHATDQADRIGRAWEASSAGRRVRLPASATVTR